MENRRRGCCWLGCGGKKFIVGMYVHTVGDCWFANGNGIGGCCDLWSVTGHCRMDGGWRGLTKLQYIVVHTYCSQRLRTVPSGSWSVVGAARTRGVRVSERKPCAVGFR